MTKVIGILVALVVFAAVPAVAFAGDQGGGGDDNIASGNDQNAGNAQEANGGDGGDDGGDGGDAGNQSSIIQQNAGDDANAEVDQ
ncbi:MAG: hypothetical protein AVDCRST_MAG45-409, partial [uncultured Solirubrobacterales bacterium]